MGGRLRCTLVLAGIVAALVIDAQDAWPASPRPQVVSYLVSASSDSNFWIPYEGGPTDVMPPHRWEWRLYDPRSGRDTLFLSLPTFPWGIRWDPSYAEVEFLVGDRIARAPWELGGGIEYLARVPSDSSLCDWWQDTSGGWHVVTQHEVPRSLPDGRQYVANVGMRWDLSGPSGTWHVAAVDSEAGGHYGECYVTAKLEQGCPRPKAIRVEDLLWAMSLDPRTASELPRGPLTPEAGDWIWVPSEIDTTLGLEMGAREGDSYYALEPVVWVDHKRNRRHAVYPRERSKDQTLGQVAFQERLGKTLIVSEFEGGYPVVVDMRSGRVLFGVDKPSAEAVWVRIPR